MKKIVSLVLSVIILLIALPIGNLTVFAATSGTTGDCTWTLNSGVLTISGSGEMGPGAPWGKAIASVIIKDGVTTIGANALEGCTTLRSVTIGNSVTKIYEAAFKNCSNLTSITIPNSVIEIADVVFYGCSRLKSVTIGNSVASISSGVFENCSSLESITLPNSVTSIGAYVFSNCDSLTNATIGSGLETIGAYAFYSCSNLKNVTIHSNVTLVGYSAFNGCSKLSTVYYMGDESKKSAVSFESYNTTLINATWYYNSCVGSATHSYDNDYDNECNICGYTRTVTDNPYLIYTVTDGKATITDCDTSISGNLEIPETLGGYPVTSIGDGAFEDCDGIISIIIPNSVTSIGDYAFYGCTNLISITLPNSITSISSGMCSECTSLTNVIIPDSVTSINYYAFSGCSSITSIIIPENVTFISCKAFDCIALTNIEVSTNNKYYSSIDGVLFDKTQTILISYPRGKTDTSYVIPNGVGIIDEWAFSNCENITSIVIPNSVNTIGTGAFTGCANLTNINIPDGVGSITDDVFWNCYSLVSVTLPKSIINIDNFAFCGCESLKYIYYRGTENDKLNISVGNENEYLSDAMWHYNSCINKADHTYEIDCDTVCDLCGFTRTIEHSLDDNNICGKCGAMLGDINNDGTINNKDMILIRRYLAGWNVTVNEYAANLDCKGNINNSDAIWLARHLAGWDGYELE